MTSKEKQKMEELEKKIKEGALVKRTGGDDEI